jgi:hypothetical protein
MTNLDAPQASDNTKRSNGPPKPLAPQDLNQILDLNRAVLHEHAWSLSIVCSTLANNLDLRDDAGTFYSVRQIVALANAIREVARMMWIAKREAGHV